MKKRKKKKILTRFPKDCNHQFIVTKVNKSVLILRCSICETSIKITSEQFIELIDKAVIW